MKWLRRFGVLLAVVTLVAGIGVAMGKQGPQVAPEPGYVAPNFTLTDFQGKQLSLSDFRGKLLFVNFWASWCPPCKAETPALVKMYHKYGSRISFLGVNLTGSDNPLNAQAFIKQMGITYPVLMDTTLSVTQQYRVLGIPTSLFINRKGVIVARVTGDMSSALMSRDFRQLLAAGKGAVTNRILAGVQR